MTTFDLPLPMMDEEEWQRTPEGEWRTLVKALCAAAVTGIPVMFIGPPGTGKSTAVRSFASCYGRALPDSFYFETALNPAFPPSLIAGGIDMQQLVTDARVVLTTRGSAADPRHLVVFVDEIGRGGPQALAALLRYTESPGRIVVGASNFDFHEVQRMRNQQDLKPLFDALAQRFASVRVPKSVPTLDPEGKVRDAMDVAVNIVFETARVHAGATDDIRRSEVFRLGALRMPTHDEIVAFGNVFREQQRRGAVTVSRELDNAIDSLHTVMGLDSARVATRMTQALITMSVFEQWRLVNPERWLSSYQHVRWDEYQRVCAQTDGWTSVTSISPSTVDFVAAIASSSHGDSIVGSVRDCLKAFIRSPDAKTGKRTSSPRAGKGART